MTKDLTLVLSPQEAAQAESLRRVCARNLSINPDEIGSVRFLKKSIDSRRKEVKINAIVRVFIGEEDSGFERTLFHDVSDGKPVVIVGAGPAGLFAALECLKRGLRPIVLERGLDVHSRKRSIAILNREGRLDGESNYAFGEGGAGAFSDGKLYTRSVKRGNVDSVLSLLVQHGASPDILSDAHPHIGSDRLPAVVENIRKTIVGNGGEVHFRTKVTGLVRHGDNVVGALCQDGREFLGPVVLASGHSARDVYDFLKRDGYALENKDIAVGVRLEHPQDLIDRMQYHSAEGRGRWLPAASYRFVTQTGGRGVYSFCMCPGGLVIPASTHEGQLVVNGMSPSSRGGRWANSGIVVQIRTSDIEITDELSMLRWAEAIERRCFSEGFVAPAQRMDDFLLDRVSKDLPRSSYIPGLVSSRMDDVLPSLVADSLRKGLGDFVRMSKGAFLSRDALLIAPETRTSSPVRIIRYDSFCQIPGLYPCGEGAGYAGGIVSAALDGIACVRALSMVM